MAMPHSLHDISMDVFENAMHVYEGWRVMNKLVANIRKAMQQPAGTSVFLPQLQVQARVCRRPLCLNTMFIL